MKFLQNLLNSCAVCRTIFHENHRIFWALTTRTKMLLKSILSVFLSSAGQGNPGLDWASSWCWLNMIITACNTTPAQTAPVAICCIKTRRRLPVRTRKSDANRTEAGLKIPAVKMATNLDAVKTPTNIRSTFEAVEDKTAILGRSLLLRKMYH